MRVMKTKTKVRNHFIPIRMVEFRKDRKDRTSTGKNKKMSSSYTDYHNVIWYNHSKSTYHQKVKSTANSILRYISKKNENMSSNKEMDMNDHSSMIHYNLGGKIADGHQQIME